MQNSGKARRVAGAILHGISDRVRDSSYRLFPALALTDKGFSQISGSESGGGTMLFDGQENIKAGQLADIYDRHLFVSTCVRYLAERAASVPIRFFETAVRGGQTERIPADDHEIARAFRWWNAEQSASDAWETVASWWLLTGVAYIARLDSDDPKMPFELWPMFTPGVQPIKGKNGILGYRYRVDGTETILLPEEVIVIRSFSTTERFGGSGKLSSGRRQINTDLRARKWNDELLQNGVHVSGMLTADETMEPKKAEKIRDSFQKQYAGSGKRAKIMVLYGGLKFSPTAFAHSDILWIEQLKMTQEDISLAFGTSLEVLGSRSPNRAALEEKRRIFWEDTVKPLNKRFANAINSTFLPREAPSLEAEHNYSDIQALQPDRGAQITAGKTAVSSGLYTINEYRSEVLGLQPIDGGDTLLIGRGIAPLSTILNEQPADNSNPKVATKSEDEFLRLLDQIRNDTERRLQVLIRRASRKMEDAVVTAVEGNPTTALLGEVEDIVWTEGGETMRVGSEKELRAAMNASGGITNGAVGIETSFNIRNTRAEAILRNQTGSISGVVRRQALDLRSSLTEGLAAGETEAGLKARVNSFFQTERRNALTIARTETTRSVNAASYESLLQAKEQYGIETRIEWRTTGDELVRPTSAGGKFDHRAMQGVSIDPNTELFVVSGENLQYPGDPSEASAGNTINCRCGTIPKVVRDPRKSVSVDDVLQGEPMPTNGNGVMV